MVRNAKLSGLPSGRNSADALPDLPPKTADCERRTHARRRKKLQGLARQVNVLLGTPDYRLLRDASIERGVPMTALLREWIEPHLAELRDTAPEPPA